MLNNGRMVALIDGGTCGERMRQRTPAMFEELEEPRKNLIPAALSNFAPPTLHPL